MPHPMPPGAAYAYWVANRAQAQTGPALAPGAKCQLCKENSATEICYDDGIARGVCGDCALDIPTVFFTPPKKKAKSVDPGEGNEIA